MANKSRMFSFRLSEKDYIQIQSQSEKAKLSMTAYIVNSALNKNIVLIDGLDETNKELKAIGRNINQLTTLCNMGKIKCLDLTEIKTKFKDVYLTVLDISEKR